MGAGSSGILRRGLSLFFEQLLSLKANLESTESKHLEVDKALVKERYVIVEEKVALVAKLEHLHSKLTTYMAEEEERWYARKKASMDSNKFHDILGAYSTILFEHGFEGVVK